MSGRPPPLLHTPQGRPYTISSAGTPIYLTESQAHSLLQRHTDQRQSVGSGPSNPSAPVSPRSARSAADRPPSSQTAHSTVGSRPTLFFT